MGRPGGASLKRDNDRYTVHGEALVRSSVQNLGDSNAINAKLGVHYWW